MRYLHLIHLMSDFLARLEIVRLRDSISIKEQDVSSYFNKTDD